MDQQYKISSSKVRYIFFKYNRNIIKYKTKINTKNCKRLSVFQFKWHKLILYKNFSKQFYTVTIGRGSGGSSKSD